MSGPDNSTRLSSQDMLRLWYVFLIQSVIFPMVGVMMAISKDGSLGNLGGREDYLAMLGLGLFAISVVFFMWYRKHAAQWLDAMRAPNPEQYRRLYTKWLIGIATAGLPMILGVLHYMFTANSWPMLVLSAASFVLIYLYKPSFRAPSET
ncbi:MAG: hypothetical protein HY082_11405 [Gammaproteobacteria bacterium]|nr:hypothetical protein [Gammaproteobacteria bacterium]